MELKGQVEEIIYQNEVNSYTVATFSNEEEVFTIVGYLPFITLGDTLKLEGKFVTHQEYGKQFKIDTFEKVIPETTEALEKYLCNGSIRGIGPKTARKIVETFGEETFSIFKLEPQRLTQIKGITQEKAQEMAQDFNENWELWQIVGYLEKFGITMNNAKNIYKQLGKQTIEKIEENPYLLVDLVRGVDFRQIDTLAIQTGIAMDSPKRIGSAIKYALFAVGNNGNTCTLKENLICYLQNLIQVSKEAIETEIINLKAKQEIKIEKRQEEEWIYRKEFFQAEMDIAINLLALQKAPNCKKIKEWEAELAKVENSSEIFLSDKQKEALKQIHENNVCVITGGPGTGKTTIIRSILEIYRAHGYKVALCAPTGRAAKRITQTTKEEAKTLHRLLEIGKIEEEESWENRDYEVTPIDADVVIVDEVSMVDVFLMNYLLKAIYKGTKLVLVGDVDQLPSVGPGNVLRDIIQSKRIITVQLDKIFRQAATSKIVVNAHKVNHGENFFKTEYEKNSKEDFFYIREYIPEKILQQVVSLCTGRLKKYGNYDAIKDIQILTPTKKGILGTKELNQVLQEALNPYSEEKKERKTTANAYREGDKVMQVRNNYDIFWEKKEPEYESGKGIFNGEIGIIQKVNKAEKQVKIQFEDGKIAWYAYSEMEQIEHAYAITIHKAQR